MASRCVFRVTMTIIIFITHTSTAAVTRRHPHLGACLCTRAAINGLVTSKRACESGNIWLSSNECYTYNGASAYCRSNDVQNDNELVFRLQLKSGDSVWVPSRHVYLEPQSERCTAANAPDNCPRIVTRAQWGARPPKSVINITEPIPKIFIHHTATPSCTTLEACSRAVRGIQNFHMDTKGWDDIGYNYLVGEDGNAYEGRGWDRVGAQVRGYNSVSLGFSVIGNYNTRLPNNTALDVVKQLITCSLQKGKTATNYTLHGHRDGGCTECPGQKLYQLIRTWPHYGGKLPHNCSTAEPPHSLSPPGFVKRAAWHH